MVWSSFNPPRPSFFRYWSICKERDWSHAVRDMRHAIHGDEIDANTVHSAKFNNFAIWERSACSLYRFLTKICEHVQVNEWFAIYSYTVMVLMVTCTFIFHGFEACPTKFCLPLNVPSFQNLSCNHVLFPKVSFSFFLSTKYPKFWELLIKKQQILLNFLSNLWNLRKMEMAHLSEAHSIMDSQQETCVFILK